MKENQFGELGFDIRGICIHNTGNDLSARELYNWAMHTRLNTGCHYLVDETETIQLLPLTHHAWHTGKGRDWGNMHCIAIEICRSQSPIETYLKAQERAVELIKELMEEYNIGTNRVYFHVDFDRHFRCPHRILDLYGNKQNFIQEVL